MFKELTYNVFEIVRQFSVYACTEAVQVAP